MRSTFVRLTGFIVLAIVLTTGGALRAQTREKGPWWPSPHGPQDQAGNSNYITPEKIIKALRIPKTGQTYELGRIYEAEMPQYGYRPYFLTIIPAADPAKEGVGVAQQDYFTGFIGQMGTQYDAFGHQGKVVRMADGSLKNVYYNGFTQDDLTDVAHAETVDKDVAGTDALGHLGGLAGDLEHVAIFDDHDVLVGDANAPCETRVEDEVAVLAVDGDEVFRLEQGEH